MEVSSPGVIQAIKATRLVAKAYFPLQPCPCATRRNRTSNYRAAKVEFEEGRSRARRGRRDRTLPRASFPPSCAAPTRYSSPTQRRTLQISQMEIELPSMPLSIRTPYSTRLGSSKAEVNKVKKALVSFVSRQRIFNRILYASDLRAKWLTYLAYVADTTERPAARNTTLRPPRRWGRG